MMRDTLSFSSLKNTPKNNGGSVFIHSNTERENQTGKAAVVARSQSPPELLPIFHYSEKYPTRPEPVSFSKGGFSTLFSCPLRERRTSTYVCNCGLFSVATFASVSGSAVSCCADSQVDFGLFFWLSLLRSATLWDSLLLLLRSVWFPSFLGCLIPWSCLVFLVVAKFGGE
ncbi:hypothetical protein VNO77_01397 [Canavalia gladiata]|uniref:Uncharacterized protein n=1 Tax=Canavalia gladiata TaxID=3824 RepID=A0AAN9MWD7_CANGL